MARCDHVVVNMQLQVWECKHCGERKKLELPMDVSRLVKVGKGFTMMHRDCPKPKHQEAPDDH